MDVKTFKNERIILSMSCYHEIDGQQCKGESHKPKNFRQSTAFCHDHRKLYSKDVLEIITPDGTQRFPNLNHQIKLAEEILSKLPSIDVRLDLHNVLDKTEFNDSLVQKGITVCGISYVGNLTMTRIQARNEMRDRIESGQIAFGLLVFRRGARKGTPEERNNFHEPGSKAWANSYIPLDSNGLFVDDSIDHVESVKSKKIDNLDTNHFKGDGKQLIKLLKAFKKQE